MVAAAPADELEETGDWVAEAELDAELDAVLDPLLDAAGLAPVADGVLPAALLLSVGTDDEVSPVVGSSWPQSAFSVAMHTDCPVAFCRLAAMHCWYTASQRKYGMVWT